MQNSPSYVGAVLTQPLVCAGCGYLTAGSDAEISHTAYSLQDHGAQVEEAAASCRRRRDWHWQVRCKHPSPFSTSVSTDHRSQLAVSLAQRFNGEVINGDAMQLYEGLPIITNKISVEERKGIPHHLLGSIGIDEPTWVVGTFVKHALAKVEEIRSRGKVAILVGGTHYYTQSLLFRDRLAEAEEQTGGEERKEADNKDGAQGPGEDLEDKFPILKESTDKLHERLRDVDPIMADRWHPNDRRKIQRSLVIYLQTGRKASDIYAEQRLANAKQNGKSTDGLEESGLRFPTLLFWIHAETETLRTRLDNRVDKMLSQGLLDEVNQLFDHTEAKSIEGKPVDETRGIWVSIGYKEFKTYMTAQRSGTASDPELEKLKADAVERTKASTRQYAKRQIRWIRIKLLHALAAANADRSMYLLDGSNVSQFSGSVVDPAIELTAAFLSDSSMPDPKTLSDVAARLLTPEQSHDLAATPQKWIKRICELCGVTCMTEKQWEAHTRSRSHRRVVSNKRKREDSERDRQEETPAQELVNVLEQQVRGGALDTERDNDDKEPQR